jgi:hypothetical protein
MPDSAPYNSKKSQHWQPAPGMTVKKFENDAD